MPRAKARADIDLVVEYYADEVDVAFGFILSALNSKPMWMSGACYMPSGISQLGSLM